jgi:hypothetical protein
MKRNYKSVCANSLLAMMAVASLAMPAQAQQTNIRSVRFYTVKTDRVGDFQAAIKDANAIMAKAGSDRYFSIWASLTGPTEYVRVDNYTKWADLDRGADPKLKEQQAALQQITTRIMQCVESSHRVIEQELPELTLPISGALPKMIRASQSRVRPDKVNEYLELVKSDVFPAAKKSGLKFFSVAQVRYGAPTTEFISVAGLDHWADFDAGFGVEKAMGKEGYQRFLTRMRPLLVDTEYNVYRLMPDLSYLPPTTSK